MIYLVVADYYSKFIDAWKIKIDLSLDGLPRKILADNMPFNWFECRKLLRIFDLDIYRFYWVGKECSINTKYVLNVIWVSLLEYRKTPLKDVGVSPVELLMNKRTRHMIPHTNG